MQAIGVDPGPTYTALALLDGPTIEAVYLPNDAALSWLGTRRGLVAIEGLECYGKPVGSSTFQTAIWIGRFIQYLEMAGREWRLVNRRDVKRFLGARNDREVRSALISRLGPPGTKRRPGATYGVSGDQWSALAIAVYLQAHYEPTEPTEPTCLSDPE